MITYTLLEKSKENPEAIEGYVHRVYIKNDHGRANKIREMIQNNNIDCIDEYKSGIRWRHVDGTHSIGDSFIFRNEADAIFISLI